MRGEAKRRTGKQVRRASRNISLQDATPFYWLCEQEGHLVPLFPSFLIFYPPQQGGLPGLPLRVSNEHLPSVRVPPAQETNRHIYSLSNIIHSSHAF